MRLNDAQMYARMLASDPTYDGRFFTGVLTTGIYCLPSCRARKPRRENVKFFPTCEAARAHGLRACKKCHPDDYARGADPVLFDIETLVAEVRANPAAFADVKSLVRRSGFGTTRLFELLRHHYHTTPAALLLRARIDRAKQRLLLEGAEAAPESAESVAAVAYETGFQSVSSFHQHFREQTGLTPSAFRRLPEQTSFTLRLPEHLPLAYLRRALGRDPASVTERLQGDVFTTLVRLQGSPCWLRMRLTSDGAVVTVEPAHASASITGHGMVAAHQIVTRLLGLDDDPAGFVRLVEKLGLSRLVAGRPGLRISRTPTPFDALLWAIVGQQVNLRFAYALRRQLCELVGEAVAPGWFAPPSPDRIASLEPADLSSRQFSRSKAEYIIGIARLATAGELDLDTLAHQSATRVERRLKEVRGLGPWSVNYVMMRGFGFADCTPLGDTGLTSGLQALFHLDQRPDVDATRHLMTPFSPYRSLATAHLWQFNQPLP